MFLAITPGRNMIINRIVEPMVKFIKQGVGEIKWGNILKDAGKNMALGLIFGFTNVDLGKKFVEKVKDGKNAISKWLIERSPAKRLIPTGRNMALGLVKGFRDAGIGARLAQALQDGMVNLGEVSQKTWNKLLKRGWAGTPRRQRRASLRAEAWPYRPDNFFQATRGGAVQDPERP